MSILGGVSENLRPVVKVKRGCCTKTGKIMVPSAPCDVLANNVAAEVICYESYIYRLP